MIASTLIAATVAAAQPAPPPPPMAAPAPAEEKKMACCERMAKGEGCSCCKDMQHKDKAAATESPEGNAGHDH